MKSVTVIRSDKPRSSAKNFARIDNAVLQDSRLSFRARGLLAYILSLPQDWHHSRERLAAQATEGVDAIGSALKELAALGYAEMTKRQGPDGRIENRWRFRESPSATFPESVTSQPSTENPNSVMPSPSATFPATVFPGPAQPPTVFPGPEKRHYMKRRSNETTIEKLQKRNDGEGGAGHPPTAFVYPIFPETDRHVIETEIGLKGELAEKAWTSFAASKGPRYVKEITTAYFLSWALKEGKKRICSLKSEERSSMADAWFDPTQPVTIPRNDPPPIIEPAGWRELPDDPDRLFSRYRRNEWIQIPEVYRKQIITAVHKLP